MRLKRLVYRFVPKSWAAYAAAFQPPKFTYALGGEDVIAERLLLELVGRRIGTYVDIGAFHPTYCSNTHRLYRRGWRGVNIEADDHKLGAFRVLRRRDVNVCAVIDETERDAEFFEHAGAKLSSMAGLRADQVERVGGYMGRTTTSRRVRTRTLTSVLEQHAIERVDFLNIDVEGSEGAILRSIDLNRFGVALIACEIHGSTLDEVFGSEVFQQLAAQGFIVCGWSAPTVFLQPARLPRIRYGEEQNGNDRTW